MKVYTGSGDRGKTSLFSGERVPKNHGRIETYGDVDELNSTLGAIIAVMPDDQEELIEELQQIQSDLFHLSSWLATTTGSPSEAILQEFSEQKVQFLENAIDRIEKNLPPLKDFILPGGHITAAWAHVARTVCRRAERHFVRFMDSAIKDKAEAQYYLLLIYLNRLSDYLFMLARYCNKLLGVSENLWKK